MSAVREWARRWGPEATLALIAGVAFLGCLGSVDLWGKREQRASAEAVDTVEHGRWLVARIQCRPRLEKPPLPRWTVATLMRLTGRRDEWMVRLPNAFAGLGTVALVYLLGRRLGDRSVGLASGLALTSFGFYLGEMRQAGNDGPLAFFTTLALYAAWRRLHGGGTEVGPEPGARRWNLLLYLALGLGFLCKGPIVLLLVGLTLVGYLATVRRLRTGLARLADGWGLVVFVLLALSWPLPVLLNDPNAARVWLLEMGQKTSSGLVRHKSRLPLAADLSWMTLPWVVFATTAVALPAVPRGWGWRPRAWFAWWWAVGNLVMFCFWSVAKPNYFLPCLPGAAVLVGMEWVRLTRLARESAGWPAASARWVLRSHWVLLFAAAAAAPAASCLLAPKYLGWSALLGLTVAAAALASARLWRRGADAGALAPLAAAFALIAAAGYGFVAPEFNPARSHRALAARLDRCLPADARTVMFFKELDEGLWFYLRGRELAPVPGSLPRYNTALDLLDEARESRFELDYGKRLEQERRLLLKWLNDPGRSSSYVLIRANDYDKHAALLSGLTTPVLRESGLVRNELVLLRANPPAAVADRRTAPAVR